MCTVIVATGVWPKRPLLVAANRDERLARPAAPAEVRPGGPNPVLAPRDLEAGGTWIGLGAHGVLAAVTNRFGRPRDPARRSRGDLVLRALAGGTAEAAAARLAAEPADRYNAFHLVIADRENAWLIWHDGAELRLEPLAAGCHVITERSLGAAETGREALLANELSGWPSGPAPSDATLEALLALHGEPPLDGVCVHLPAAGYGTRSSTIVWLGASVDEAHWRDTDGPPCSSQWHDRGDALTALRR